MRRHLASKESRARIKAYPSLIGSVGNWDNVMLLDIPGRADISRLSLGEIGRRQGRDPHDCALDILADEAETLQRPMVLLTVYDEDDAEDCVRASALHAGLRRDHAGARRPARRQDVPRRLHLGRLVLARDGARVAAA